MNYNSQNEDTTKEKSDISGNEDSLLTGESSPLTEEELNSILTDDEEEDEEVQT
jgi:hypothetical protein